MLVFHPCGPLLPVGRGTAIIRDVALQHFRRHITAPFTATAQPKYHPVPVWRYRCGNARIEQTQVKCSPLVAGHRGIVKSFHPAVVILRQVVAQSVGREGKYLQPPEQRLRFGRSRGGRGMVGMTLEIQLSCQPYLKPRPPRDKFSILRHACFPPLRSATPCRSWDSDNPRRRAPTFPPR